MTLCLVILWANQAKVLRNLAMQYSSYILYIYIVSGEDQPICLAYIRQIFPIDEGPTDCRVVFKIFSCD